MSNALGQLPNAPLIYVLAQIRFSHVPKMGQRWEDIHEKLFGKFPISQEEKLRALSIKDGEPDIGEVVKRWHLLSRERNTGVILSADSLVFHTTEYENSTAFFDDFSEVVEHCATEIPEGVRVVRCGLRYIDLLRPEDGLEVDQQVVDAFRLPVATELGNMERMEQIVTYRTPVGGVLNVRHRQSVTPELLPGDIFPNILALPARLTQDKPEGRIDGLLDYDHFKEQEMDFDAAELIKQFKALHKTSSAAFRETTTEDAQKIWNREAS